jgi:hypothetical protein
VTPEVAQRYSRLKELRETQPEQELRTYKAAAAERIESVEALLSALKDQKLEEISELHENIDDLRGELQAAQDEIAVLRAKLRAQEENAKDETKLALGLCSDMSGIAFQKVTSAKDETTFDILQSGRNGMFHYSLVTTEDEDGVEAIRYTPLLDDADEELVACLPEYFTESLTFSRDAVSTSCQSTTAGYFFSRVHWDYVYITTLTLDSSVLLEDMSGSPSAYMMWL